VLLVRVAERVIQRSWSRQLTSPPACVSTCATRLPSLPIFPMLAAVLTDPDRLDLSHTRLGVYRPFSGLSPPPAFRNPYSPILPPPDPPQSNPPEPQLSLLPLHPSALSRKTLRALYGNVPFINLHLAMCNDTMPVLPRTGRGNTPVFLSSTSPFSIDEEKICIQERIYRPCHSFFLSPVVDLHLCSARRRTRSQLERECLRMTTPLRPFTTHIHLTQTLNCIAWPCNNDAWQRTDVSLHADPTFDDPTELSDLHALQLTRHIASILLYTFTARTTDIREDRHDEGATSSGTLYGITGTILRRTHTRG
jgi:hypothetical protein